MDVHVLFKPVVVLALSDTAQVVTDDVGANDGDSEHVAVVLEEEATSEVGPRKRHLIINY
jgi:hypothetical protein